MNYNSNLASDIGQALYSLAFLGTQTVIVLVLSPLIILGFIVIILKEIGEYIINEWKNK